MSILADQSRIVYIASPISTFSTPRYDRMVAHVRARFPDHEILTARGLWESPESWRQLWPLLHPRLTRIIAFSDEDGRVGAGVVQEILDGNAASIPIEFVTEDGRFVPLRDARVRLIPGGDMQNFAQIVLLVLVSNNAEVNS